MSILVNCHHCFSYVVYGKNKKYFDPIFDTYQILEDTNLTFTLLIFCDDVAFFTKKFEHLHKIKVISIPPRLKFFPRISRFLAADNVFCDYYHFRDSDSIISQLELLLIKLETAMGGNGFIIRNHPLHFAPMLAGLFTMDRDWACKLSKLVKDYPLQEKSYYYDQIFLSKYIYAAFIRSIRVYSSFYYYLGENVHQIAFDQHGFCGRPIDFQSSYTINFKHGLKRLIYIPVFHRLYQRTKFIWVMGLLCK